MFCMMMLGVQGLELEAPESLRVGEDLELKIIGFDRPGFLILN